MAGEAFLPLFGYTPDPAGAEAFVASLPHPTLADAGPDLQAAKTDVHLERALLKCFPSWRRGSQPIGSCVGWGFAMSVDVLASCDIVLRKEPEVWGGRTIEASIYGVSRVEARGLKVNPGGDGSTGFHAAKAVRDWGTLHYGQDYGGTRFDRQFTGTQEKAWGRNGMPDELEPFAKQRVCTEVTLVTSFADCARAISNGYPVALCSMRGFSMRFADRGSLGGGWLTPAGTWAHCMMACSLRVDRPALLVANSWGDCYSGKVDDRLPPAFQRTSGWVDAEVIDAMCRGRDSYALAGFTGFKPTSLPSDWLQGIM
jgi:hypothetical protein